MSGPRRKREESPGENGLTPRQEMAVVALLECPTIKAAAAAADVPESTLRRWLKEVDFSDAYRLARRRIHESNVNALARTGKLAVRALHKAVQSDDERLAVKAAIAVLDLIGKGVDALDAAADEEEKRRKNASFRKMGM
jgi:hypothetical protein